ncbi:hypothetical protein THAOC_05774 [Thalassiosira oceanica]|uniref:Uncharacterized protein n=1 Tax=Thalassiosira oceanica TaxID=159749 RepID=K0TMG1_THAOC|nr:hypothetical protein THAOC_05774 [Thalassiosira oceanica]|eukprot:EJK72672.1 hypothetical protein THAOC_05774 [Thalassiosira oceanica]
MIAEQLAKMFLRPSVRPSVRPSSPKATEKRAALCVTYYLGYLLEEVLDVVVGSETGVEVNSKPISNFHPSANSRTHQCTMRLAAPLTAERRENEEVTFLPQSWLPPYFSPLSYKATAPDRTRRRRGSTIADALDAPMHHEP